MKRFKNGCSYLGLLIVLISLFLATSSPLGAEDFDWRNVNGQNWLPEVRNQFLGTCWAHAAAGTLESKYMLTRDDSDYRPDVSEQQIVWGADGESDGGKAANALNYITSTGLVLDSEIPYQPSSPDNGIAPFWPMPSGSENRRFKSTSNFNEMAEDTNLATVKNYLKTCGPLTLRCEVDNDWYDPAPSANRGNHAVVIVGFHDNLPGESAPGGGYWIIRNSWGDQWNGDGYGAIAYATRPTYEDDDIWNLWQDNVNVCGITSPVFFTGSMATVYWQGSTGASWTSGGSAWTGTDMYGSTLPIYSWENKETTAIFNAGYETNVTLDGKVIAHGITVNGAGYVFNGINNPSLTVTGGGIQANESITINSGVKVGAPQTWNIASGKTVTISGDLHTIISKLTLRGSGDVYVSGKIDGGGAANQVGMTRGSIEVKDQIWFILTGGGQNYTPTASVDSGALIALNLPAGTTSTFSGVISGAGGVQNWGEGTGVLSGANTYTGTTLISGGALRANLGTSGTPANNINYNSFLSLNGGMLENRGTTATTFTRTLGTSGANKFNWTDQGGGFSAGDAAFTIKVNNGTSSITWGAAVGSGIRGTLKFNSLTSNNVVTFQNAINLNGAERTIQVTDNPSSASDWAVISGNLTGGTTGGINKTGTGLLVLTGTGNSYGDSYGDSARTIITAGALQAANGIVPGASCIQLDGGVFQSSGTFDRGWYDHWYTNMITWNNGGFAAKGGKLTVNINCLGGSLTFTGNGHNGIGGTMVLNSAFADSEVEVANNVDLYGATRTVQVDDNPYSSGDYATISGAIADSIGAGGIVKTGAGVLRLSGSNTFSGDVVVNGGTLIGASHPSFGAGSSARTLTVNTGGTLTFAAGDMYGGHASTAVPTLNIQGGTVTNSGGTHNALNNVALNNGVLSSTSDAGEWATWNLNGAVTSNGDSAITYTAGSGQVMLQSGDQATPVTTLNVQSGTLTISSPMINGRGSSNLSPRATGLTKTGVGTLRLAGTAANTYTGATTITDGVLVLEKSGVVAVPGNLNFSATSGSAWVVVNGDNQFGADSVLNFQGGYWPHFLLYGHNVSLAGINDGSATGVIENTQGETWLGNGTLTVNNVANCSFNGYIRDNAGGSGTLRLIKNLSGTLTLIGSAANDFTGGMTINNGIVSFEQADNLPSGTITINSPGHLYFNGQLLGAAASMAEEGGETLNSPDTSIVNNGTFGIDGFSSLTLCDVTGSGSLAVSGNAVLTTGSIVQDTLIIGGTSTFAATAVPEPSSILLLVLAIALGGGCYWKKHRA